MSVNRIDVFPNYSNRNLSNLNVYKSCDKDDESCIHYMFKNGTNIYKELDPYNHIPKQIIDSKLTNVFNTNNIVKNQLLNDNYIKTLANKLRITDTDIIINSILLHLRPYIFSNKRISNEDIDSIKNKVKNTLQFNEMYMKDINSQLMFLFLPSTINHIKNKVESKIKTNKSVKNDYIISMLKYEINNYRSRYGSDREVKRKPDTVKDEFGNEIVNIYVDLLSKLNNRDIFNIINDTISKITSNIQIEQNMINNNSKLDKWDTILGDNNSHGLRQYTSIKLNNKKPKGMLFNMNY